MLRMRTELWHSCSHFVVAPCSCYKVGPQCRASQSFLVQPRSTHETYVTALEHIDEPIVQCSQCLANATGQHSILLQLHLLV